MLEMNEARMMNRNEMKGWFDQAKGRIKQTFGNLVGNDDMAMEGKVDLAMGRARSAAGLASRKADEALAIATRAIKK